MEYPVVQTLEGKIKGTFLTDFNGEQFHVFLSIPYGKPPVGNLRFKAPQPAEPWTGVRDATKQGNCNIQKNPFISDKLEGSEDCLNLHVFTKKLPIEEQKLKPVIVWIHGGAFTMGSHDVHMYGPHMIMTEDIVFVSITYRLGILGFLSLQDTSLNVPGNAGLKDQVLALKWIQRNIENFNGNPNNVTIFGESAGGASVEYLILSPTAKNLFHKAIIMSGSVFNPWSRIRFDPIDFAKFLGHSNLNEKEILKLLTDMSAVDLHDAQENYDEVKNDTIFSSFTPVIELPNTCAFMDKHPIDILHSGEYNAVPVIIGYCDNEGFLFEIIKIMTERGGKSHKEKKNINYLLPSDTDFNNIEEVKKITDKLNKFYSKEEYKNKPMLLSDSMFIIGVLVSAINQAKFGKNPVYLYRFSFDEKAGLLKKMLGIEHKPDGASHGDDLGYIFNTSFIPLTTPGEVEKILSRRFITMWTNFAKYGNPTPEGNPLDIKWKPIEGKDINFLDIGRELVLGLNPEDDRLQLWKEIFKMNPLTSKFL